MQIDDIHNEWSIDSQIDRTELGAESIKIPQLHAKYFKFFSNERLRLKQHEQKYKILYRQLHEYYMGSIDEEEQTELGWEPQPLKILKQDIPMYIDAHKDIIDLNLRIAMQKEKIDLLDSIIRSVINRGFQIKNAIDWEKFKHGN